MLVRKAAAGGALQPAGQEGETGLPRRPGDTRARGQGMGPPAGAASLLTCPWGWEGHPGSSRAAGRRRGTPAVPGVPRYSSWGDRGGVSLGPPAHRGCSAGPVPNTGDQQRGPVGCPRPASAPSPTVSASPAACKRRAGLDGAAGERHRARATSHQDRLRGTQARPSAPSLNQGAAICSPKFSNTPNFCVFLGFNQSTPGRSQCQGGDTDPAQPQAGLSLWGHTGGCGFVPTLKPAMGTHF